MSQNVAKDYRVMVLPLEQVEPDPDNIRFDYEIESLRQALRAALERGEEFEEPISVYPTSRKGTYRIKHGHRRFMAASGIVSELHFLVVDPPRSEQERLLAQLNDNANNDSLSDIELGQGLHKLKLTGPDNGYSIGQLAALTTAQGLPFSKGQVQRLLDLATRVTKDVQEMVHKGQLAGSAAWELRGLPAREQLAAASEIVEQRLAVWQVRERWGSGSRETEDEPANAPQLRSEAVSAPSAVASPLLTQAQVGDMVSRAVTAITAPGRAAGERPRDPERSNSPVSLRYEMPVRLSDAEKRSHDIKALLADGWGKTVGEQGTRVGADMMNWAHMSVEEARSFAERFRDESRFASTAMQMAVAGVRGLLDGPGVKEPQMVIDYFKLCLNEFGQRLNEQALLA